MLFRDLRNHIGLALGAALCLLAAARPGAAQTPPAGAETSPLLRGETVVLPTEACGHYFVAETFIDDAGPLALVLDTGATITTFAPDAARRVGVRSRIERVRIGALTVTGRIRCDVREIDHLGRALGMPIDGILGHQVFRKVLLTYDYPASEVRVRKGVLEDDLPGIAPMSRGKRPLVGALVGARKINVLLDTGALNGLSLSDFDELSLQEPAVLIGASMRIDGLHRTAAGRLAEDVTFGSFTLRQPVVREAVGDSLLGQAVLKAFVVTLDQQRGRVQIVHPDGSAIDAPLEMPSLHGAGMFLWPEPDGLVVRAVLPGSAAEAAGFQRDDRVRAIDGVPVGELGCERQGRGDDVPQTAVFLVERGSARLEIAMTTALLVK